MMPWKRHKASFDGGNFCDGGNKPLQENTDMGYSNKFTLRQVRSEHLPHVAVNPERRYCRQSAAHSPSAERKGIRSSTSFIFRSNHETVRKLAQTVENRRGSPYRAPEGLCLLAVRLHNSFRKYWLPPHGDTGTADRRTDCKIFNCS